MADHLLRCYSPFEAQHNVIHIIHIFYTRAHFHDSSNSVVDEAYPSKMNVSIVSIRPQGQCLHYFFHCGTLRRLGIPTALDEIP